MAFIYLFLAFRVRVRAVYQAQITCLQSLRFYLRETRDLSPPMSFDPSPLNLTPESALPVNFGRSPGVASPWTVILADDHPVVRLGIKALLAQSGGFTLLGEAADSVQALNLARRQPAQMMILDLMMPGTDGFRLVQDIRREAPELALVIFSALEERVYAPALLAAGIRAYVRKDDGLPALLTALRTVAEGGKYASASLKDHLFEQQLGTTVKDVGFAALSAQELNVFRLCGLGLSLKELGAKLGISPRTVGTHRERIKAKLRLRSIRELEEMARRRIS